MKSQKSKKAAEKVLPADIMCCGRCGAKFASIEGIKIMDGMILQKARCPVCGYDIRSLRHYTAAHGAAFAVALGALLSGSGMKPAAVGEGYALYSAEQQAESRKSGK